MQSLNLSVLLFKIMQVVADEGQPILVILHEWYLVGKEKINKITKKIYSAFPSYLTQTSLSLTHAQCQVVFQLGIKRS